MTQVFRILSLFNRQSAIQEGGETQWFGLLIQLDILRTRVYSKNTGREQPGREPPVTENDDFDEADDAGEVESDDSASKFSASR
eukprot:1178016-Prorocentrum_minimum.AAC.4